MGGLMAKEAEDVGLYRLNFIEGTVLRQKGTLKKAVVFLKYH